jgi:hypothetical protein
MLNKRHRLILLAALVAVAALLLPLSVTLAQTGDGYDLTWWTVDVGGHSVSGGDYALMGTIGQPEAAPALTGGDYALTGGFWLGRGAAGPIEYPVYLPLVLRDFQGVTDL